MDDASGPIDGPPAERVQALLARAAQEQLLEQRQVAAVLVDLRSQLSALAEGQRAAASAAALAQVAVDLAAQREEVAQVPDALADRVATAVRTAVAESEQRVLAHVDARVLSLAEALLGRRPSSVEPDPDTAAAVLDLDDAQTADDLARAAAGLTEPDADVPGEPPAAVGLPAPVTDEDGQVVAPVAGAVDGVAEPVAGKAVPVAGAADGPPELAEAAAAGAQGSLGGAAPEPVAGPADEAPELVAGPPADGAGSRVVPQEPEDEEQVAEPPAAAVRAPGAPRFDGPLLEPTPSLEDPGPLPETALRTGPRATPPAPPAPRPGPTSQPAPATEAEPSRRRPWWRPGG